MILHLVKPVLAIVALVSLAISIGAQGTPIPTPSVDTVQVSPSHSLQVARYANEPLRVTGIKCTTDDERWLDGLLVEVENVSDKPVSIAKYYLRFDAGSSDGTPVLRYWFGDPAGARGQDAPDSPMLKPGKRTTLQVLRGEQLHSPASAYFPRDVVPILEPLWVGFGDGTRWERGLYAKN